MRNMSAKYVYIFDVKLDLFMSWRIVSLWNRPLLVFGGTTSFGLAVGKGGGALVSRTWGTEQDFVCFSPWSSPGKPAWLRLWLHGLPWRTRSWWVTQVFTPPNLTNRLETESSQQMFIRIRTSTFTALLHYFCCRGRHYWSTVVHALHMLTDAFISPTLQYFRQRDLQKIWFQFWGSCQRPGTWPRIHLNSLSPVSSAVGQFCIWCFFLILFSVKFCILQSKYFLSKRYKL